MTTLAWVGWQELLVVCIVAVLIFGRRLPEVGRSLGQGLLEFKRGLKGVKKDVQEATEDAEQVASEAKADVDRDEPKG